MNKLNFLSKLVIFAVTGFGSTTMLRVTSVQAFQLTLQNAIDTCLVAGDCSLGDKTVYDISVSGALVEGGDPTDVVPEYENTLFELEQLANPLDYEVVFDFANNETAGTGPAFYTGQEANITYTIETTDADLFIDAVRLDSDVAIGTGTTTVTKTGNNFNDLTSFQGNADPQFTRASVTPPQKIITVTDTFSTTGDGAINEFNNEFGQTSSHIPEPGTILGLLAVGVLGLGLKGKKQS